MKKAFIAFIIALISSITFYLGMIYGGKNNTELIEANSFKRECLENYDKMSDIIDGYINRHINDDTCNELIDSLTELGYYEYYNKVDSLYGSQL